MGKAGLDQKRMARHVEGPQNSGLQPGDTQSFVKSLISILSLMLTQNVLTTLSLITYVMLLQMRV